MNKTKQRTVSSKGQVVIPKSVRDLIRIAPGTKVLMKPLDGGIVLVPKPHNPIQALIDLGKTIQLGDMRAPLKEHRRKEHR